MFALLISGVQRGGVHLLQTVGASDGDSIGVVFWFALTAAGEGENSGEGPFRYRSSRSPPRCELSLGAVFGYSDSWLNKVPRGGS